MNTKVSFLTLLVAALAPLTAATLQAAPASEGAVDYPVTSVAREGAAVITVGSTDSDVCRALGYPHRRLSDDVWVYFHYRGSFDRVREDGCSTLLLTVVDGKVAQIMLVNRPTLSAVATAAKVDLAAVRKVFGTATRAVARQDAPVGANASLPR